MKDLYQPRRAAFDEVMLPTSRVGFVNPLDVSDTCAYEFYRLAPANAIASMISIGLRGFSSRAAESAVEENLTYCLSELSKREVECVLLGGLPLVYNLGSDYSDRFRARCASEFGLTGATSVDAVNAAMRSLGAKQVVVIDKWSEELNQKVFASLEGAGLEVVGAVTDEHTAEQVKSTFEQGASVALRLAEAAMEKHPEADCLFIAGGAWLVAPYVPVIEREFGVSVVSGQEAKIWYALNLVNNFERRPEHGRLMDTPAGIAG